MGFKDARQVDKLVFIKDIKMKKYLSVIFAILMLPVIFIGLLTAAVLINWLVE